MEPPSTALGVWPTSPAPGWALGEEGWTPVSLLPSHIEMTLQRKKGILEIGIGVLWPPQLRRALLPRRRHVITPKGNEWGCCDLGVSDLLAEGPKELSGSRTAPLG